VLIKRRVIGQNVLIKILLPPYKYWGLEGLIFFITLRIFILGEVVRFLFNRVKFLSVEYRKIK